MASKPTVVLFAPTESDLEKAYVPAHARRVGGRVIIITPYNTRRPAGKPVTVKRATQAVRSVDRASAREDLFRKPHLLVGGSRLTPDQVENPQKYTPDLFTGETQIEREARLGGGVKAGDTLEMHGLKIKVENPRGSIRSKTPRTPGDKPWQVEMHHHYGDIEDTKGHDGDAVDAYVGPNMDSDKVFVANQHDREGHFNEHKVLLGFDSTGAARAGYHAHYPAGWTGLHSLAQMTPKELRHWLKHGDMHAPAESKVPA